MKTCRKYQSEYRHKLANKISKLKNKKDFVNIFNIIQCELGSNISVNRNGIFFNINILSDANIENLTLFLTNNNDVVTESENKIQYVCYNSENINSNTGPKLSNQEKTILKKIHQI
jgi:hypothetical protein